ncbi:MAG: N-glycosylase [Thermoproteota archaeon]|nr:MAG: N-glycosylase [Candidatus Korarchaeota archaeon]RLG51718.1 MAG: N-glycosylase [Candidatus Korarchaeota archaeon]
MEPIELAKKVRDLRNDDEVRRQVENRLKEFELIGRSDRIAWLKEMVFCILAANFSAIKAYKMALELEKSGLLTSGDRKEISLRLRSMGHRFYNTRAAFIVGARNRLNEVYRTIPKLTDFEARDWLRSKIKGFGMKESSHFLRNVGRKDLAIIDRHILRVLIKHEVISEIPRVLTRRKYIFLEEKLREVARLCQVSLAELDLYLWYSETGFVFR